MTTNHQTLMRLPLGTLHKMCLYWGLTFISDDRIYTAAYDSDCDRLSKHRVKRIYVRRLLAEAPCCVECLKSDFAQWRKV